MGSRVAGLELVPSSGGAAAAVRAVAVADDCLAVDGTRGPPAQGGSGLPSDPARTGTSALSASIALPDLPGAPPITRLVRREPVALRLHNVSLWAGDTWKLHPRITIDAGLRWEWNPPPSARGPARPVLVVGGPDSGSAPELASSGGDWWRPGHRDFAPRLSVAWRVLPGGGIVLRAGSGLHYNLGSGHVLYTLADQPGYSATALVAGPVDSLRLSHLDGAPPAYPGVAGALWNLRTPATLQSTVSADIALPGTGSLSTGWVSTLGRRLVRSEHLPLDAGPYRFIQLATHHGSSNYHAWQSRFRSRNTHGLEALISYAWAHSIDNGSRDSETRLAFARRLDRGSSDFDVRHALSAAFLYAIPRSGIRLDGIFRARSGFPFNPVIAGWLPEPGEPPALTTNRCCTGQTCCHRNRCGSTARAFRADAR